MNYPAARRQRHAGLSRNRDGADTAYKSVCGGQVDRVGNVRSRSGVRSLCDRYAGDGRTDDHSRGGNYGCVTRGVDVHCVGTDSRVGHVFDCQGDCRAGWDVDRNRNGIGQADIRAAGTSSHAVDQEGVTGVIGKRVARREGHRDGADVGHKGTSGAGLEADRVGGPSCCSSGVGSSSGHTGDSR